MDGNGCRFDDDDDDGTDHSPTEVLPFAVLDGGGSETLFPCNNRSANTDCSNHHYQNVTSPSPPSSSSSPPQKQKSIEAPFLTPYKSCYESIQLSTASLPPPGLMSSVISQDDSVLSTTPSAIDDSFHQHGSGSLLETSSARTLGQSSHLPHSRVWPSCRPQDSSTFLDGTQGGSVGFSLLMRKADDTNNDANSTSAQYSHYEVGALANTTTSTKSRMPRLKEESELSCSSSTSTLPRSPTTSPPTHYHRNTNATTTTLSPSSSSSPSARQIHPNNWLQNLFTRRLSSSSSQPYLSVPLMEASVALQSHRSIHYNNSQSWAGGRRLVESVILDDTSYQVSISLATSSVREVLDVIGNPDFLPLWCEPLHKGMIITKSSEGSQRQQQQQEEPRQREYDGEWIEATTSELVSPSASGPSPFDTVRTFWNCLGFPSYAKITMFVERLRGQIGLTMGPFPGGITCSHTFTVIQEQDPSFVTVVDTVRVTLDENEVSESLYLCGACSMAMKKCFLPTLKGYMEQSSTSLSRLRVLVEHGETGYCIIEANLDPSSVMESPINAPLLS